ncbi:tumor susceptibility gene 101 protein-like [Triplophysa dalaica]|uniref:tumor susceptibility gene 101 protein-like n=1 Tax=Triplophysa dalaica TaxID=1582913 RepID=UPI0024DFBBF1|nr:tumor susceptibility gene 101 protein-like [Triplophysa dalaica]
MAVVHEGALKKMLKKYKYRDLTVRDITNVISRYKDLKPVMDGYVFNDGSSRDHMSLTGTVPVSYRGNVYNIPICLWLLDTYPYNPPICFVKPTSAMMIKTGKHIDANGKIYLPYLHEWKHPQSDLYGLIQVIIVVFGEEPPVFYRLKNLKSLWHCHGDRIADFFSSLSVCLSRSQPGEADRPSSSQRGEHFRNMVEVAALLMKGSIEPVPLAEMSSGFYSPDFIVPILP